MLLFIFFEGRGGTVTRLSHWGPEKMLWTGAHLRVPAGRHFVLFWHMRREFKGGLVARRMKRTQSLEKEIDCLVPTRRPQIGWPKRLALIRATPPAEFDVIGVQLHYIRRGQSNLSMSGTFLTGLLPPLDICGLPQTQKRPCNLNSNAVISSIWSFCTPKTIIWEGPESQKLFEALENKINDILVLKRQTRLSNHSFWSNTKYAFGLFFLMMMIAFITFKSSLVPLFEGLWSSNSWEFELSGFSWNRTDDLGIDSPSLWPTEPRLHVRSCVYALKSIILDFRLSVSCVHIFCFSFSEEKTC